MNGILVRAGSAVLTAFVVAALVSRVAHRSREAYRAKDVAFDGCALVRAGPVCEVDAGKDLTFWLEAAPSDPIRISFDGITLEPKQRAVVEDGVQLRILLPTNQGTLVVEHARAHLRLIIHPHQPFTALVEANQERSLGGPDHARAAERALLERVERAGGEEASRARALIARIRLRDDDVASADAGLERALSEALDYGRLSNAFEDAAALAYLRIDRENDIAGARAALARVEPFLGQVPQARAGFEHYSGMAAHRHGELALAREHYVRALLAAKRIGFTAKVVDVAAPLAALEAELGRYTTAIQLIRDALSNGAAQPACTRGPLHANLGWLGMLALQQLGPVVDIAFELEQAMKIDSVCGDPYFVRNDLVNLGLWALDRHDVADAERHIARLDQQHLGQAGELAVWEAELRGYAAAAHGHFEAALLHFSREAALADARVNLDEQLRAQVARGEMLEKLGRPELALEAFRRADDAVAQNFGSPLAGLDKDGYFGRRDTAARHLIDALVLAGQVERAFSVAVQTFRRALARFSLPLRAQGLSGVQGARWAEHIANHQRLRADIEQLSVDDWQLSAEDLEQRTAERATKGIEAQRELRQAWETLERENIAAPGDLSEPPDELLLLVIPGRDSWLGFSRFRGAVRVVRLEQATSELPTEAVQTWVSRLEETIAKADRVAVLAYGLARTIDFASLELDGSVLIAQAPLVYRLGIEGLPEPRSSARTEPLIVADPGGDLAGARQEGLDVARWLGAAPEQVLTGAAATRDAVLAGLQRASLFHYAGHGEPARPDDLSGLRLREERPSLFDRLRVAIGAGIPLTVNTSIARLTTGDILALPMVPRDVILSACDAGRSEDGSSAGGWSLAHAFVLAGAQHVIAPVRPLPDADTTRLQLLFYEELARDPSPSRALARAQDRARRGGIQEWSALRLFVP